MYFPAVIATSKRQEFRALSSAPRLSISMTAGDLLSADRNDEKRINSIFLAEIASRNCVYLIIICVYEGASAASERSL